MTLPTSRNTTYAASSPVKSADLNALQDCVVAGKHGDLAFTLLPIGGLVSNCAFDAANGYLASSGAPWFWLGQIVLPVATRIKSVTFARRGTGATSMKFWVRRMTQAGVWTTDVNTSAVDVATPPASWATTVVSPNVVIGAGEAFALFVDGGSSGQRVGSISILADKP